LPLFQVLPVKFLLVFFKTLSGPSLPSLALHGVLRSFAFWLFFPFLASSPLHGIYNFLEIRLIFSLFGCLVGVFGGPGLVVFRAIRGLRGVFVPLWAFALPLPFAALLKFFKSWLIFSFADLAVLGLCMVFLGDRIFA